MSGDSFVQQLILITHETNKFFDYILSLEVGEFFLDNSKVFYQVLHNRLVEKLRKIHRKTLVSVSLF